MWIEPEHVAKWWGPNGFTTTIDRMDVRPGGVWQFVMHGPDGTDYQNRIVYEEIARPEHLAYSHVSFPVFRSTVTFAEERGKTRVTMRMVFESATDYDAAVTKFGAIEGGRQTFARLADHLAQIAERVCVAASICDAGLHGHASLEPGTFPAAIIPRRTWHLALGTALRTKHVALSTRP